MQYAKCQKKKSKTFLQILHHLLHQIVPVNSNTHFQVSCIVSKCVGKIIQNPGHAKLTISGELAHAKCMVWLWIGQSRTSHVTVTNGFHLEHLSTQCNLVKATVQCLEEDEHFIGFSGTAPLCKTGQILHMKKKEKSQRDTHEHK